VVSDQPLVIPETLLIQLPDGQIEELALDEYLKGVVPTALGLQKPKAALEAQAITSRSYAVSTRRHTRDGFDMCTTAHCQIWNPEDHCRDSDGAVDETAGLVITHQGRIVAAPYFGHCDGRTRNSEEVWSGKIPYCRSVPCSCGNTELHGHGVGLCLQGVVAMAHEGSTAEDILKHYYTDVELRQAAPIPRTGFQRSIVLGQVVDGQGQPRDGLRLLLHGPQASNDKGTTADGRFWFTELPAGQWELEVVGSPVHYANLLTDGRNTLELRVVVPDTPPLITGTVPVAHPRQLIGSLGLGGLPVTVTDPAGNELTVLSGSAELYGPGGFVVPLSGAGIYTVRYLDQSCDLEIGDSGLWVQFSA
jgi:hypothetical protein